LLLLGAIAVVAVLLGAGFFVALLVAGAFYSINPDVGERTPWVAGLAVGLAVVVVGTVFGVGILIRTWRAATRKELQPRS
jgi:hypothetical protein